MVVNQEVMVQMPVMSDGSSMFKVHGSYLIADARILRSNGMADYYI